MKNFISHYFYSNFKNKSKVFTTFIIFLFLFIFTTKICKSQNTIGLDSRGKEFYVSFLPNFHGGTSDADSIFLFFAVQEPTIVNIHYRDRFGTQYDSTMNIVQIDKVITFGFNYNLFEIPGLFDNGFHNPSNTEKIVKPYFKVTASNDISLFGYSKAVFSNDAFMVLPTHSLGSHHFVMAYKDSYLGGGNSNGNGDTPSEFVVTATQNNTHITIKPSCRTVNLGNSQIDRTLQEGESFLVSAAVDAFNTDLDLTGSEIISDKPVAVFGGEQRAVVPNFGQTNNISRDMVVEQIPAINFWGRNCFIVPFATPQNDSKSFFDIYRILAAFDGTEININGNYITTLNKGEFLEDTLNLKHLGYVEASKPILSAGFKKTSGGSSFDGDPFMLLFPPKEQFCTVYLTLNSQVYDDPNNIGFVVPSFTEQYITVIVPDEAINNVVVDGKPINQNFFNTIVNSGFSYAHLKVTDGSHTVKANAEVGLYIYGYGPANSYGYLGGISAKNLDFNPPQIFGVRSCGSQTGVITDTNIYDSGFLYPNAVKTPVDSMLNTAFYVEKYKDRDKKLKYSIDLINPLQDGSIQIVVTDSMGISEKLHVDVPGFTIAYNNAIIDTSKYFIGKIDSIAFHKPKCQTFTIQNYGKFPQTFNLKTKSDSSGFIVSPTSMTLEPNTTQIVTVCFNGADTAYKSDEIIAYDSCLSRKIAFVQGYVFYDKNSPQIESSEDKCNQNFFYTLADSLAFDSGIKSISFSDSSNISVNTTINQSNSTRNVKISVIDFTQDASYKMIVSDSSGRKTEIDKIIPGNTLSIGSNGTTLSEFNLDTINIGGLNCLEMPIFNYGKFPVTVNNIRLKQNIKFSIPASQFPIIVTPQSSENVIVCFTSNSQSKPFDFDTIKIEMNCYEKSLRLKGRAQNYEIATNTNCKLNVKIGVNKIIQPGLSVLPISPNPTANIVNIDFGIGIKSTFKVEILNQFGELIRTPYLNNIDEGEYNLNFDLSDLTSGIYFIKLTAGNDQKIQKLFLVK